MADPGWFSIKRNGDDWDLYNDKGQLSQKFTAHKLGSTNKAEDEARREMHNRNRRLERQRKGDQPPRGRHAK